MAYVHPTLNYVVTPADILQSCPYDKNHCVRKERLSLHLVKCRDAYLKQCKQKGKQPSIFVCMWNTSHHITGELLREHEMQCRDRESLTQFTLDHSDPNFKIPGPPAPTAPLPSADTEDWEQEDEKTFKAEAEDGTAEKNNGPRKNRQQKHRPAYDPSIRLSREPLIYNPQGLTRSERKQFREFERMRWQEQNLMQCILNTGPSAPESSAPPRFTSNSGPRICNIPGATVGITVQEPYENPFWDYGLASQSEPERINNDKEDPKKEGRQETLSSKEAW